LVCPLVPLGDINHAGGQALAQRRLVVRYA
jgi:hypothetical protein